MYEFLPEIKILEKRNQNVKFSENASKILEKRYLRKGDDGRPVEDPTSMFARISQAVADPDRRYGSFEDADLAFFNLISSKRFFPNSPTFTGAGTPLGQLAACFVLPMSDDMGKSNDGIFSTLRSAALIQQTGGGNGFSFSRLRPKGDLVRKSMGKASGPVGFLSIYDAAFSVVSQGGVRRGANMGVLRIDHPDIRDFIKCKAQEGSIKNFNISVALTDKFMEAVESDSYFELINPRNGEVWEKVKARELFDEITSYAYRNGEPGVLFIDTANRANPVPHLYDLEATNPCGEQWLGPYENCCLGSVNLGQHIKLTADGQRILDWNKLAESFTVATHFLDNVVSANKYVPEIPELERSAHSVRRIGLGFMGLGDALFALRIRYGSETGIEFAAQVAEFMRYYSLKESVELARERGSFPAIKGSIYDRDNFRFEKPVPLTGFVHDFGRPSLDWDSLIVDMKRFGVRNGAQTTIAPTGTISTVAGIEGYGCEPVFALAYIRNVYQAAMDEKNMNLTYTSPLFEEALHEIGLSEEEKKDVIDEVVKVGSCQHIKSLPDWVKDTFVVSSEITPEEHVFTQAAIQRFIDNSISKTCNFPETAKIEDVKKTYMLAWKFGCKGLTVYVTGSRQEVVLETHESHQKKKSPGTADEVVSGVSKDRPEKLNGATYKIRTPQGSAFITVNRNGGNNLFEVFINIGKVGSDIAALSAAMGRLISGWLRSSPNPKLTALEIIDQLSGIGGRISVGFGQSKVSSLPDAVAKVLSMDLGLGNGNGNGQNHDQADHNSQPADSHDKLDQALVGSASLDFLKRPKMGDLCPSCGNTTFVNEEGCRKCYSCSYSVC